MVGPGAEGIGRRSRVGGCKFGSNKADLQLFSCCVVFCSNKYFEAFSHINIYFPHFHKKLKIHPGIIIGTILVGLGSPGLHISFSRFLVLRCWRIWFYKLIIVYAYECYLSQRNDTRGINYCSPIPKVLNMQHGYTQPDGVVLCS